MSQVDRISTPVEQLPATAINSSAMERLFGAVAGFLDFTTWFNDAAGQQHPALKGRPTTDVIVSYLRGTTRGNPAFWMVAKQVDYNPTREANGGLSMAVSTVMGSPSSVYPPAWGQQITAGKETHASATSSTSLDNTAATTAGIEAVAHYSDIATGTPTIVLEHSADNSTFATLITFTAVADGAEPTAERKTASGTVNRYLRATTTGTFTNLKFVLLARRGTAVDRVAYA